MGTRSRAIAVGGAALLSSQIVIAISQIVYSGVTSRTLAPSAFGAYTVALSGAGLAGLLLTTGLPAFLLASTDVNAGNVASVILLAWSTGAGCALLLALGAPLWAYAWNAPESVPFSRFLALQVLFSASAAVQVALVRREGRPLADATIQAGSSVLGMSIGVVVVLNSQSALALSVTPIVTSAAMLGIALAARRVHYARSRPAELRRVLGFAGNVSSQNLGFFALLSSPNWVVSVAAGGTALGQFSRAALLTGLPSNALSTALTRTLQPSYRHLKGERDRREAVTDAVLVTSALAFPPFLGLATLGPLVVNVWLGPGWEEAGQLVRPLAVGFGVLVVFTIMANAAEMMKEFRIVRRSQVVMALTAAPLVALVIKTGSSRDAALILVIVASCGFLSLAMQLHSRGIIDGRRVGDGLIRQFAWAVLVATLVGVSTYAWLGFGPGGELAALLFGAGTGMAGWIACIRRQVVWGIIKRRGLI